MEMGFAAAKKLQSAMEYLMTYGWAILVIAIILGALFQFGVFGSSSSSTLQPSCLASAGYLCATPTMNTTGILGIKFGQIGSGPITITGIACGSNSTVPASSQAENIQLSSGQTTVLAFSCPTTSNAIGTSFKGTIWIIYTNSNGQSGIVDKLGAVTARISTTGSVVSILGGTAGSASFGSHYIYCVAGYGFSNAYYAPIYSNGAVGSWTATNSYPIQGEIQSCAVSGGYVTCVGGYNSGILADTALVYYAPIISNGLGAWTATTPVPVATYFGINECSASGGYIYCAGGLTSSLYSSSSYYAALSSGTAGAWSLGTAFPVNGISSCPTYGGYQYCIGGYSPSSYDSYDYYAAVSSGGAGAWTASTAYPIADGVPCITYNGDIYCVAGFTGSSAISTTYYAAVSSTGVGSWTSSSPYPITDYGFGCAGYNGYDYCVGGDTGGAGRSEVYYAPLSATGIGSWTSANAYPILSRYTGCVTN